MTQQLFNRSGEARKPTGDINGKPIFVTKQNCSRCGGQGGSDKWGPKGTNTGWTCWRCGGSTWDPTPLVEKLYTAEQNAKLNVSQAKRDVRKAEKRAEAAALEQARREREKSEIISQHSDLIAKIRDELRHGEIEILSSVLERLTEKALPATERQIEVVENIIARNTAERARRARAAHVGEIKERRDFTLTLLYSRSEKTGSFPTIWSHWSLFTDENGCKIACKSDPYILGLVFDREQGEYPKGQTVSVKATVVDHTTDKKGEPLTYINRPKQLGAAA